jgi:hypothetical protein
MWQKADTLKLHIPVMKAERSDKYCGKLPAIIHDIGGIMENL